MPRLTHLLTFCSLGLGLSACGAPEVHELTVELPRNVEQPIFGGAVASGAFYDATVGLVQRSGGTLYRDTFCSGTLVTPDVVVTAAHCLDVGKRKTRTASPDTLGVIVAIDALNDPNPYASAVVEAVIHPGYDSRQLLNDIGLLRLAAPVPASVATPVPALPASLGFTASDVGATLNFAGFGQTETGGSDVRMEVDGVLGGLGCTVAGCYGADDPATQISYEQQTAGPCFGDSGGPAFIDRGGQWYLGGVTSWGDNTCTQFGVSTRVDAYQAWIDGFVGTDPGPEPEPTPEPDPGVDTCGDGVCGAGESCDGRGVTSACGDCAGKTNGKPSNRFCYVEGVCEGPGC